LTQLKRLDPSMSYTTLTRKLAEPPKSYQQT
jgi:hypothetical protein